MGGSQDLALKVVLQAQDLASGKLRGFGSTLVNLAGDAGPLLGAMMAISAAVLAIGVASVQAAQEYQQQMNMVQALTGATSDQMAQYDAQLKALAMDAGVAPAELVKGLYNVVSAGYTAADAMQVLTLATEDAKIGLTDAKTTSNALTVALKAFNVPAKDFVMVNGEMLRTVTAGKMSMSDYASAISKTSSVAVQYKDSMADMNAVLATLTASGIKNANVAGTDYNNLLKVLNGNTAAVAKASHKLNPAFNSTAFSAMNVHDKVMYLNKMIVSHGHNITEVIGKQQNAAAAFTMLSTHADTYATNLKNLSDKQANAKATSDAWAVTQSGFTQQMSRASASVQVLLIDIGQQLLPILTQLVSGVAPVVTWLINFATATSKNEIAMAFLKGGLVGFAAVALMILVPAFIAWATAAGAAALATLLATWPILLIGAIIAVVVGGIILAVQHWGQIMDWISGKSEQMRIKVAEEHVKMAIAADQKTELGAKKAIENEEKKKQGILEKLKSCHSEAERRELMHQLALVNAQIHGNEQKIQKAEADKKAQLKKQKELHDQYLEAQKNWFQRTLDAIGGWLTDQQLKLGQMLLNWGKTFNDLKDKAGAKLNEINNGFKDFFTSLPGKLLKWGEDMIQGFIDGIKNKIGELGNTVGQIGQNIHNLLHFSKPDTGPLADADTWMPDMMNMMSQGIIAGNPKLLAAVNMTAKTVAGVGSPPAGSIPYGQPPMSSNSYSSTAGGNTHNGDIVIHAAPGMNIQALADEIERRQNSKFRRSGVMGNSAGGARNS